jgi:hypothetical protein
MQQRDIRHVSITYKDLARLYSHWIHLTGQIYEEFGRCCKFAFSQTSATWRWLSPRAWSNSSHSSGMHQKLRKGIPIGQKSKRWLTSVVLVQRESTCIFSPNLSNGINLSLFFSLLIFFCILLHFFF